MFGVIGISPTIDIKLREKLSIVEKRIPQKLEMLKEFCDEVVILSTCNRTEVYFYNKNHNLDEMFKVLGWQDYKDNLIYLRDYDAIKHIFKVVCGFDSLIIGEEQILGQVKRAYEIAKENKTCKRNLSRLFLRAISCGKDFRRRTKLYMYPVSSASIVANEVKNRGIKKVLILGFGEIGFLTFKYLLSKDIEKIIVAVRDKSKVTNMEKKAVFIEFKDWRSYVEDVECIISATSAPHPVIKKEDINKEMLIFDLAVPRDVEEDLKLKDGIVVYDIDDISKMNENNVNLRYKIMQRYSFIIDKYIEEFLRWEKISEIIPLIERVQGVSYKNYKVRLDKFIKKHRNKDIDFEMAEFLFKSVSDYFAHRIIKALKEEYLEGRGDECIRIIEKIIKE
ncbi:MAG: glutamyl-tRNA reductase [Caloramator sp.]|nr:glutamyl-tRNA reductase [Caloramator sp.]